MAIKFESSSVITVDEITTDERCCQIPDPSYLKSVDGILKITILLVDILLLVISSANLVYRWFGLSTWIAGSAAFGQSIVVLIYSTKSARTMQAIGGWYRFELIYSVISTGLMAFVGVTMIVQGGTYKATLGVSSAIAALGFANSALYGLNGWRKYRDLRRGKDDTAYL